MEKTRTERIGFPGGAGAELAGRLELPQGEPRAWALFAHCFTCSKDVNAAVWISRALVEAGIGVLRFDFTGLGGSGGDFANTGFSSNTDDLVAAAEWLRENRGAPVLLVGHSLGGAAALAAAGRIPGVRAVATIGAPFEPAHVKKLFAGELDEIKTRGEAVVTLAGREFRIRREMLDDLEQQQQERRIRGLNRALLVLHAPADQVVGVENAAGIFKAAMHPKSFIALDGADHLLSRESDARYAAGLIAGWAERYLAAGEGADTRAAAPAGEEVHVATTDDGPFTVAVRAGRHQWTGDEPTAQGGADFGPNPYQMLSAGLGACTVMTVSMYAKRKGWPLDKASVTLEHRKVKVEGAGPGTPSRMVDRIERRLRLEGALDEEQRARLLGIADRCPVHRTLLSGSEIVTSLEDG